MTSLSLSARRSETCILRRKLTTSRRSLNGSAPLSGKNPFATSRLKSNAQKCGGPNPFANDTCRFCGAVLNKSSYFEEAYRAASGEDQDEDEGPVEDVEERSDGFLFQKVVSLLVPIVGFIMGAIMMSGGDEDRRAAGKACFVLAVIGAVASGVLLAAFGRSLL